MVKLTAPCTDSKIELFVSGKFPENIAKINEIIKNIGQIIFNINSPNLFKTFFFSLILLINNIKITKNRKFYIFFIDHKNFLWYYRLVLNIMLEFVEL